MPTLSSPQLGLKSQIILNKADIEILCSDPKIILPVQIGYINVFVGASVQYLYKNSIFTNIDNVLQFYQLPTVGDPVLVSNSINALNFMGNQQNGSLTFIPANPYIASMADMVGASIAFTIANDPYTKDPLNNPSGGDAGSLIMVTITYNLHNP